MDNKLISRKTFISDSQISNIQLSRDGKYISFISNVNEMDNIFILHGNNMSEAYQITHNLVNGVSNYGWAFTNKHILFLCDNQGDENWNLYCIDIDTNQQKKLTNFNKVNVKLISLSYKYPNKVIIGVNNRNNKFHDIYLLNIENGEMKLLYENNEYYAFIFDDDYNICFALRTINNLENITRNQIIKFNKNNTEEFINIPSEDLLNTIPLCYNSLENILLMKDACNRNTSALISVNVLTKEQSLIASSEKVDISDILINQTTKRVQAVSFNYLRKKWVFFDKSIKNDFEFLKTLIEGDISIASRSFNDNIWIICSNNDTSPNKYYKFNRSSKYLQFISCSNIQMANETLLNCNSIVIKSRDKLDIITYYTVPDNTNLNCIDEPYPTVLLVHGGPWTRSNWGYKYKEQWLANRGYLVINANFRGSKGFGKRFLNAGIKEWGGKMNEDLIDVINWFIDKGYSDPKRIAIMGSSYGGYASLAGLSFTPEIFACGISIGGISNLASIYKSSPNYWKYLFSIYKNYLGDFENTQDRKLLIDRSPIMHIDKIKKPLLIVHGKNDVRSKSDDLFHMANIMKNRRLPVIYVEYPDEGHNICKKNNRISMMAVVEEFLSQYLGGRCEKFGDDINNSNIMVPIGANLIKGLKELK